MTSALVVQEAAIERAADFVLTHAVNAGMRGDLIASFHQQLKDAARTIRELRDMEVEAAVSMARMEKEMGR